MLDLQEFHPQQVSLTEDEYVDLEGFTRTTMQRDRLPQIMKEVRSIKAGGPYLVRPGSYVGRFTLKCGLMVNIRSQFSFVDLAAILRVARNAGPTMLEEDAADGQDDLGLVDFIATAYDRELRSIVHAGLPKAYESRTFNGPPYSGVPDIHQQLTKNLGLPGKLVTRGKRPTKNVPLNHVLLAALSSLERQSFKESKLTLRLRSLLPYFADVTPAIDPLAAAYAAGRSVRPAHREAFELAKLVLANQSVLPTGSGRAGGSVIFWMPDLWQDYVEARFRPSLRPGHRLQPQFGFSMTTTGTPMQSRADLVELDPRGKPVALYDAKYTEWNAKPSRDDLYQVISYAYRLGLDAATLVYPGHDDPATYTIRGIQIHLRALDVPADLPVT